jgi:excinuclease UvrABC nuclease subunit
MSKPAAVYRLYDANNRLLYVGASSNPQTRFREHKRTAPWWGDVARHTIRWHESRQAALAAETDAICAGRPRYNVRKTRGELLVQSVRIHHDLWRAARAKAKAEGRSLSDVLDAYLRRYVSTPPRQPKPGQ